jgi:hypothetical protein
MRAGETTGVHRRPLCSKGSLGLPSSLHLWWRCFRPVARSFLTIRSGRSSRRSLARALIGAMDHLTTMISDDAEKAMANGVKTCLGTVRASLDMIAQAVTTPTRPTRKFGRAQPSRCCNTSSITRYQSAATGEWPPNYQRGDIPEKFEATTARIGSRAGRSG